MTNTTYAAHVEHFKAELGREVAAMTQDVGRLHQEKTSDGATDRGSVCFLLEAEARGREQRAP